LSMRNFVFTNIFTSIKNHKRIFLFGFALLVLIVSYILTADYFKPPVKPPVVGVSVLSVFSATPQGEVRTINLAFPMMVKFSQALGSDTSGMLVSIEPEIPIEKFVVTSEPNVLWIGPAGRDVWADGVKYTITIKKGSKNESGAVLNEDYSFSFSATTQGVSMLAN